nr:putative nucleotidyltransferase, ribonuclease H [Tanacetum cinerariifolium]
MVAFLKKPQESKDFHQIVDFLKASHIRTLDNGEMKLNEIVIGHNQSITKASVMRHLKLAYANGISSLPTTKIFEQLALMGYVTDSDKLTFQKGLQKAWGTRLKFSTAFHPQKDGQSERTIQTLEDMLRSCALEWTGNWDDYICLVEFAYNNSWHASIKCAPFEMLYGRKCRAPICWDPIEGPEMIEVTNAKVAVAKEKLKEARTRQKS